MIKIDNKNLSSENKKILNDYQIFLMAVKYMNEDTSVSSYIEDLCKYLEYMENQKGVVCEIIGKCLTILNDEEKLAKAQPQQITTAMGTLIDKFVNMTPADKEDKEIHVVISRAGEESDDK